VTVCCDCEILRVHFARLSIEKEKSCLFDSVSVYDGEKEEATARVGQYCGHRRPPDVLSTGPLILVVLKSDRTINDGGFNVTWSSEITEGYRDVLKRMLLTVLCILVCIFDSSFDISN